MATSGEFIGLNEQGISKINVALSNYIKAVTNNVVRDPANFDESLALYLKGWASFEALRYLLRSIDEQTAKLVSDKLGDLQKRINNLGSQYKNNDNTQANTLNTKAKSILKS